MNQGGLSIADDIVVFDGYCEDGDSCELGTERLDFEARWPAGCALRRLAAEQCNRQQAAGNSQSGNSRLDGLTTLLDLPDQILVVELRFFLRTHLILTPDPC